MIKYKTGNILEADTQAIVNTVNCVGVMGRGIALEFKRAYPDNFKAYAATCKNGELQPGKMFVYNTHLPTNPQLIINFPTKRHWKDKSMMKDIKEGLKTLVAEVLDRKITSIAIPPLGSGLGGLNWKDVRLLIDEAFRGLENLEVLIFEPKVNILPHMTLDSAKAPTMTPGRAALINLIDRYLSGLMTPFITLLEIHKLMYFMQEAGEHLKLRYTKGHYGPYAENLRPVLERINGYFISGYANGGEQPDKKIELCPGALTDSAKFLEAEPGEITREHLEKVTELVDGFETPFGLELLATVHWIVEQENAASIEEVIEKTYAWNNKKKRFSPRQIQIAYQTLAQKRWISL